MHTVATTENWYQSFFSGVTLDLWNAVTTPAMTLPEVDFFEKALQLAPGAAVLDVPCGNGRHALELAARGYAVTAVDIAPENITAARAAAAARQLEVRWQQADMRQLPWPGTFDGAYCAGNSFGYLGEVGDRQFLRAVAQCLKPGARFLIDTGMVAESLLPTLQERTWYEFGGIVMLINNRHDFVRSRLETELTFVRNGQVERRSFIQRIITYRELARELEEAGFGGIEGYGGHDGQPYQPKAHHLLMVASKR